tara:strand:- start:2150 stop:2614 length:465 start_codon:yes stop_codon:yes gene_type:complete
MKTHIRLIILSLLFISCISKSIEVDGDNVLNKKNEVYELRIYYTHEGKFDDIISRFENHTTKLFEKHGFTNVGYWTSQNREGPSYADEILNNKDQGALYYIVSFPNMKEREKSWDLFINDPDWKKVYNESRKEGPIVSRIEQVFLNPTTFSNLK